MRSRSSQPRTTAQKLDSKQEFLLLMSDLTLSQRHRFELPMFTAFDAGEVALDGAMELWRAGVECIVVEAMLQKRIGGLDGRGW